MNKKGVDLRDKASRDRTVEERDKDIVGNGDARERERTRRENYLSELAPPGCPLFDPGLTLARVGASRARVGSPTLPPLPFVGHPLVAHMVEGAGAIRLQVPMLLTQIERGARARRRV